MNFLLRLHCDDGRLQLSFAEAEFISAGFGPPVSLRRKSRDRQQDTANFLNRVLNPGLWDGTISL